MDWAVTGLWPMARTSLCHETYMKCPNVVLLWTPKEPRSDLRSIHNIGSRTPHPDCTRTMLPKLVALVEDKKCKRLQVSECSYRVSYFPHFMLSMHFTFFCLFETFCSLASSTIYFEESTSRKRLKSISSIQCPQSQYRASWNLHQGRRVKSKWPEADWRTREKEGCKQGEGSCNGKGRRKLQIVIRTKKVADGLMHKPCFKWEEKRWRSTSKKKLQKWRKRKIHRTTRTRLQQRRKRMLQRGGRKLQRMRRCKTCETRLHSQYEKKLQKRRQTATELSCKAKTQPDPES